MKNNLYLIIAWIAFILSSKGLVGQVFPRPVAHYPLEVWHTYNPARFTVTAWDVSGNAYHGNIANLTQLNQPIPDSKNYVYMQELRFGFFPTTADPVRTDDYTGVSCVKKDAVNNGVINIPAFRKEHQLNLDAQSKGFSVNFWLYWESSQISSTQPIIRTPDFEVYTYNKKIEFRHASGISPNNAARIPVTARTDNDVYTTQGWYFINVSMDIVNNAKSYTVAYYRYEDTTESPTHTATVSRMSVDSESVAETLNPSQSRILGEHFIGLLYNLRVYNELLSSEQIEVLRANDVDYAHNHKINTQHHLNKPYAQYNFDGEHPQGYLKNEVGQFGVRHIKSADGAIAGTTNRFGQQKKALSMSPESELEYPALFGDNYLNDYDAFDIQDPKGFTVSFWIKINSQLSSATKTIGKPFADTDTKNKILYGQDGAGDPLFGIATVGDRIGMFRYTDFKQMRKKWFLWLYNPMSFNNGPTGWYHIIWSQSPGWSRFYMWKPGSSAEYTTSFCGEHGNACVCKTTYFELQDLKDVVSWKTSAGNGLQIDDLQIYNYPLSEGEAKALHLKNAEEDNYEAPTTLADSIDVFLILGQSNAAGRCEEAWLTDTKSCPLTDTEPLHNVFLLDNNNIFVPATEALARYSSVGKQFAAPVPDYFLGPNIGYTFANRLQEMGKLNPATANQYNRIGLIVNARGGLYTKDWQKDSQEVDFETNHYHKEGNNAYQEAVRRVREMKGTYPNAHLRGVLWLQGESDWDKNNPQESDRPSKFTGYMAKIIDSLRKDLNNPTLPMLFGECAQRSQINKMIATKKIDPLWVPTGRNKPFFKNQDYTDINSAIGKLPHLDQYKTHVVQSSGLITIRDGVHYSPKAYRTYGRRFANQFYMHTAYTDTVVQEDTYYIINTRKNKKCLQVNAIGQVRWNRYVDSRGVVSYHACGKVEVKRIVGASGYNLSVLKGTKYLNVNNINSTIETSFANDFLVFGLGTQTQKTPINFWKPINGSAGIMLENKGRLAAPYELKNIRSTATGAIASSDSTDNGGVLKSGDPEESWKKALLGVGGAATVGVGIGIGIWIWKFRGISKIRGLYRGARSLYRGISSRFRNMGYRRVPTSSQNESSSIELRQCQQ